MAWRIFRFTLAELVLGTILAGAVVGDFILRNRANIAFKPVVKETGQGMQGTVADAQLCAPDALLVLTWARKPNRQKDETDRDYVYKVNLRTREAVELAGREVTYSAGTPMGGCHELHVCADGKWMALPDHNQYQLEVRDTETGALHSTLGINTFYSSHLPVRSPQGEVVIYTSRPFVVAPHGEVYSPLLTAYNVVGSPNPSNDHRCPGLVAIFPDEKKAACVFNDKVTVRDFPEGNEVYEIQPKLERVRASISPDGAFLIVNGQDKNQSIVLHMYDAVSGKKLAWEFDPESPGRSTVVFAEESRHMAALFNWSNNAYATVRVWNREGRTVAILKDKPVKAAAFPSEGKILLIDGEGQIELRRFAISAPEIALWVVAGCAVVGILAVRVNRSWDER